MIHPTNCPACAACRALGFDDPVRQEVVHALAAHMVEFDRVNRLARAAGLDLDDVLDTVGECVVFGARPGNLN
jgi:hypothetical protein